MVITAQFKCPINSINPELKLSQNNYRHKAKNEDHNTYRLLQEQNSEPTPRTNGTPQITETATGQRSRPLDLQTWTTLVERNQPRLHLQQTQHLVQHL